MEPDRIKRIPTLKSVSEFRDLLVALGLDLPVDDDVHGVPAGPLAAPLSGDGWRIGNRFAIHPMEGWDGTLDGKPTEKTLRRWRLFGLSGAKLIWGGEAAAVRHDGRANPNQLLAVPENERGFAELRETLLAAHREHFASTDDLLVGLQLTHSGRFSRPNRSDRAEPRIAYRHPLLDSRLPPNVKLLSDDDLDELVERFVGAARMACDLGFDFVDIKHCHGYLGHELLGGHTREGRYGGSFENRTRFLRSTVDGVRAACGIDIGVRISAFDTPPFRPDPAKTRGRKLGPGIPEDFEAHLPYRYGFGLDANAPLERDLSETFRLLELFRELGVQLVNVSCGSPYYNPHIQRPALYPPSDGYRPPEDPLVGVARQIRVVRELKERFPDLVLVGTGYSYLQEFIPNVAQAVVRLGWADSVGLGRLVLSYPELPRDVLESRPIQVKRLCRTFSDCTTAPRNGLPSGCYPLDPFYKKSDDMARLREVKARAIEQ